MDKVIFYAMTQKGYHVLNHIAQNWRDMIAFVVFAQNPQLQNDYSKEIIKVCKINKLEHFQRGSEPEVDPDDFILAISWRWLIDHPSNRLIIFHDSLLPKYRGFAPLVNMLIKGERELGVSAIFGAKQYDMGDIISQKSSPISYPIKISEAIRINNNNYLFLVEYVLEQIRRGADLKGVPQEEAEATYSIWRDFDDYYIDWRSDASVIQRQIDALGPPYLGARSKTSNGADVVITEARTVEDKNCELRHFGKIISLESGLPTIICGTGLIQITSASVVTPKGLVDFLPITSSRVRFT